MNIMSLDLSTKSSGWAIFKEEELVDYGCITSASLDLIKRIYIMQNGIKEALKNTDIKIDKIIVEEVRPEGGYGVGNQKTHKALMWLQAAIAFMLHDNFSIEIEYIYPSSWRSTLELKTGSGIKRVALKQADIDYVKNKYNIEVNDDIADAICIGCAYYTKENDEINWE